MLEHGADPNNQTQKQRTALHTVILFSKGTQLKLSQPIPLLVVKNIIELLIDKNHKHKHQANTSIRDNLNQLPHDWAMKLKCSTELFQTKLDILDLLSEHEKK